MKKRSKSLKGKYKKNGNRLRNQQITTNQFKEGIIQFEPRNRDKEYFTLMLFFFPMVVL
jgi:hypothetical protein